MGLPQPAMQMIYFLATCYPDPGIQAKKLFFSALRVQRGIAPALLSPFFFFDKGPRPPPDPGYVQCNVQQEQFFQISVLTVVGATNCIQI